MRRRAHAALWDGFWGKATALVVALAAVAPASPAEVSAWLHGILPWAPWWAVQAIALAVLVVRLAMAKRIADTPEDRRRR